jgi:tRNA-Thr(GGU) m(6)t(6)A37 methyltransferase TsaA
MSTPAPSFSVTPVAYVRGGRTAPTDDDWDAERCVLELDPRFGPTSLAGLDAFSHLEVVYVFDRVVESQIAYEARHPRERTDWPRVGIFAQRGKARPNRIGVSRCRLLRIEGTRVHVAGLDAIDGTPILDIKPYMREFGPRGGVTQPAWATELMAAYYAPAGAAEGDAAAFTPGFARHLALYNQWQNLRLYELCAQLGDDARRLDRGMFFGSIHRTLNHILVVDRVLLPLLTDGTLTPLDHRAVPFDDFAPLRVERARFDEGLLTLAAAHDDAWFGERVSFYSERLGRTRNPPRAFLLAQLFNHQTHHRSQVTCELFKLGIDYGVTDLPYNPAIPY